MNRAKDIELLIPIRDINQLIIDNYKAVMSTQLLCKLAEKSVSVVFCGVDHLPVCQINHIFGSHQAPAILKKQMNWTIQSKQVTQKYIVKAKIENQLKLLEFFNKDNEAIKKLDTYIENVENGDITNREGLAAKVYFRALYGKTFRRFNDDILNAGLNYGYAILRSQISKCIIAKGLNTTIGIFHKGPNNLYNLSDDIIEPFRPIIDHHVYLNLRNAELFGKSEKQAIIRSTTRKIDYKDSRQTIFNVITQYIDNIFQFFETGDLEYLNQHPKIPYVNL